MTILIQKIKRSRVLFWLAFALVLFTFVWLGISVSLSASEGPDEVAHFFFNRYVARHGFLPLDEVSREEAGYKADLPPLYYAVVGGVGYAADLASEPRLKTNRDNVRLALVTGHKNIKSWRIIRTEDPIAGEILLWHLGRWSALFFGVVGLVLLFFLLRANFPNRPWLALSGMAMLAFLPTYVYVSSVTSYESLTGTLMTAYFLTLFFVVKKPTRMFLYFLAGVLIGLASANRHTPWTVLPLVPLLIVWLAYAQQWPWRVTAGRILLFVLGVTLGFGWWILYIVVYFNKIEELGLINGVLTPLLIGDGSGHTSQQIASVVTGGEIGINDVARQSDSIFLWVQTFFVGIWGRGWLGWVMLGLWGAALAGLYHKWRSSSAQTRLWLVLLVAHVLALLLFPLLRFIFSGSANTAMSQHILYPAGAAFILLLIYGLTAIPKISSFVPALLLVLATVYAGRYLNWTFEQEFTTFPIWAVPVQAEEEALTQFFDISLLDVHTEQDVKGQVLNTSLVWRPEQLPANDYWMELTLVDNTGQPKSHWVGQPLNGRYPIRAWEPHDRIRDTVSLPVAGLPPGEYQLMLRVGNTAERAMDPATAPFELGPVQIDPQPLAGGNTIPLKDREIVYRMWPAQFSKDNAGLPLYRENSTVSISTDVELDPAAIRFVLVAPDQQQFPLTKQTGATYSFVVTPQHPNGPYRLNVELWEDEQLSSTVEGPELFEVETEERQFTPDTPPENPLSADFAGYVKLLGYNMPQNQVLPGTVLPITFYWQAAQTIGADLILFNHLIGPDGTQRGGRDRQAREVYSTMFWAPDEVVSDPYDLIIPPDTPPGTYYLLVGLYLPVGESSVSLPLMENGEMSDVTHVTVGPIEVISID